MQDSIAFLTPQELEQRIVTPFVRRQFPFMPEDTCSEIELVKPERMAIQRRAGNHSSALPAQYSYTYICTIDACRLVVYILASANGDVLRVLMSK